MVERVCITYQSGKIRKYESDLKRLKDGYNTLNRWIKNDSNHKYVEKFLLENNYKKIALYGLTDIAKRLCENLLGSQIRVSYGIDRNGIDKNLDDFPGMNQIVLPNAEMQEIDAIIVTVPHLYDGIKNSLRDLTDKPILNIEDIVFKV